MIVQRLLDGEWSQNGLFVPLMQMETNARAAVGVKGKRHGAAIVDRGKVVAVGVNSYKTHPLQKKFSRNEFCIHLHAEIAALARASQRVGDLTGMTACVLRLSAVGYPAMSRPCEGCLAALLSFGIKEVYHT